MSAVIATRADVVPTGLPFGAVRWGAHLCHFFRTARDLEEIVVPFFAAGLANREQCVWIASAPLGADTARAALAKSVDDLDARMHDGQIEIVDEHDWPDSERTVEAWLAREHRTLADGFAGLRVSGAWLDANEWRALAINESRMHRALGGRRITALCSYLLDRCGPYEIIDILRNHKSALLRRDGVWEQVGSATAALALVTPSRAHTVEFFDAADFPAASMARRLGDALAKDHAALALCTREHLAELKVAIERRYGASANDALASGRLVFLDTEVAFAEIFAREDFEAAVDHYLGTPVRELIRRFGRVRIYGELVDVCCRHNRRDLAIRLEAWWNAQVAQLPIELHCGYNVASFDDADSLADFHHVCDQHGSVFTRRQIAAPDPDRIAAELQQVSSILEHESARLVTLQRITSLLGEAVTYDNIGHVVVSEIAATVHATRSALVVDGRLVALRGITTPDDAGTVAQVLEHVSMQWTAGDELPVEIAWIGGALVAVLPLIFAHDRIGTLLLGFDDNAVSIAQRALVDDLARQVALAVERARVFEQAERERLRAERALASKDQFLAMLGHELRNPLSPILSATQLMRLRSPDQLVEERLTIERSVTHMIRLVDDLLDVSQIQRGAITLAREPSEVAELVRLAIDTARLIVSEGTSFVVDVPPQLVVDVDRVRMRQVIANLLLNAVKHSRDRVEIAARAHGDHVEIAVRDFGDGIDAELLPSVFDLFVQGKQGTDRATGGLGIGLAIAKSVVELHGGTIKATSEGAGKGSTFIISLARWQTERTTDQITAPAVDGTRRVLVVDDNEDAAWLLAEALRLLGHDVQMAHDGHTALAIARAWSPDVALCDIGLPGMNGFELCRELVKLSPRPYTVAVSGYGQPKDRALAREAGFDAHFVKPVDLRDVQAAIDALAQAS